MEQTTGLSLDDLDGFKGRLIQPTDANYDEERALFNGMIDRHPALIAAVFAGIALLGIRDYSHYILSAQSDPMIVALCLGAIDCYVFERPRAAFVLGVLAALGRPFSSALVYLVRVLFQGPSQKKAGSSFDRMQKEVRDGRNLLPRNDPDDGGFRRHRG